MESIAIMKLILIVSIFLANQLNCSSQGDSLHLYPRKISLLVGYHQTNCSVIEAGISHNILKGNYTKHNSITLSLTGEAFLLNEIVYAPKLSIWYKNNVGTDWKKYFFRTLIHKFAIGSSILYYSNLKELKQTVVRPEISFNLNWVNENFYYYEKRETKKYKRKRWLDQKGFRFKLGYSYDFILAKNFDFQINPQRFFITIYQEGNSKKSNRFENRYIGREF